jgi:hypothetical protein
MNAQQTYRFLRSFENPRWRALAGTILLAFGLGPIHLHPGKSLRCRRRRCRLARCHLAA